MPLDLPAPSTSRASTPLLVALLVLLLGLALSAFAVHTAQRRLESADWYNFSLQFDRLEASITEQLNRPQTGIQALIGLQQANQTLTPQSFRAWVASQDMDQHYQGVIGFGFLEHPRGGAWQVRHLEPAPATPLQLTAQDSTETLDQVVNTGDSALLPLAHPGSASALRSQFLYLTPVYRWLPAHPSVGQRRQALIGLVFAQIDLNQLLLPSLALADRWTDFDIVDRTHGIAPTRVYASSANLSDTGAEHTQSALAQRHFSNHRALLLGGRVLELQAGSNAGFDLDRDRNTPLLVGVSGALLSLLLAVIFWLLMAARVRAQKLARRMTSELNRLALVVQRTAHLVFMVDAEHKLVWVNEAFSRFTGVALDAAVGKELERVIDLQYSDDSSSASLAGHHLYQHLAGSLRQALPARGSCSLLPQPHPALPDIPWQIYCVQEVHVDIFIMKVAIHPWRFSRILVNVWYSSCTDALDARC